MNTDQPIPAPGIRIGYLIRESVLLILLIYFLMVGGTYNGMVLVPFQRMNMILTGILGLVWVLWMVIKKHRPGSTLLDLPLLAWLIVVALAAAAATNPRLSWEAFTLDLALVLVFYLLIDLLRSGWEEALWLRVLLISAGVVILFGFIQLGIWYAAWFQIGGWRDLIPPAIFRVNSTLGHPNILAAYLNLILPLGMAAVVQARSRLTRILAGAEVLLVLGLLYATSSRGGWLGTAAALGVFLLLFAMDNREQMHRGWSWLLGRRLALGGLALVGLLVLALVLGLLYRQMQHPSHPGLSNPADARNYIWAVAFQMAGHYPILGEGPFTFGTEFIRTYSYPPGMLLAHAHNYLLNSLAEMGIVGLLAVLALGVTLVWAAVRRWRTGVRGERTALAGVIAALAGVAVHSQLDTPETVLVINLILSILIAILVAPVVATKIRKIPSWAAMALPILGWILLLGLQFYSLRGASLLDEGISAAVSGEWASAARSIDAAVALDPGLAHYHFQSGITHAQLAFSDDPQSGAAEQGLIRSVKNMDELKLGIQEIQTGLALDGSSAVNWANLGILQWAGGEHADGLSSLHKAWSLAPDSGVFLRMMGWMEESMGHAENARTAYRRLALIDPTAFQGGFFQETQLRREIAVNAPALSVGWSLLGSQDFLGAEKAFRAETGLNNALAYRGLGLALMGQKRYSEAEKALRTSDFIQGVEADTQKALATLYTLMGKDVEAKAMLASAEMIYAHPPASGPEMLGDADVATYIYHREALPIYLVGLLNLK